MGSNPFRNSRDFVSSERGVWFRANRRVMEAKTSTQNVIPRVLRRLVFMGSEISTVGLVRGFSDSGDT